MRADPMGRPRRYAAGGVRLVLAILMVAVGADRAGATDTPAASRAATLIPSGTIEGWQVSVARWSSPVAASLALQQAKRRLPVGTAAIEARAGPWLIVSHLEGDHIRTLQLRDGPEGGSQGFESTWRPRQPARSVLREAVPVGARILGAMVSDDTPRRGETLVAEVPSDAITASAASAASFGRLGFAPIALPGPPSPTDPSKTHGWQSSDSTGAVMFFRRGHEEVALTLSPGPHPGATSWVAHWVGASR